VDALETLVHDALFVTAAIAMPMLAATAIVGTAVAVVQAATQVQEQTLTLLPKILTVGALVALFGEPAMHLLAGLFSHAVAAIPALESTW